MYDGPRGDPTMGYGHLHKNHKTNDISTSKEEIFIIVLVKSFMERKLVAIGDIWYIFH